MNKCDLLSEVKSKLKSRGYVIGRYAMLDSDGNEQCCAVGYALETLGMTCDEMHSLKGYGVDDLYQDPARLKSTWLSNHEAIDKANFLLIDSGLTVADWVKVQHANDHSSNDVAYVVGVIDNVMTNNNC